MCVIIADICLYTLWAVLSIAGFLVQVYMERNRPQFPERSRRQRRRSERRASELPTQRSRRADDLMSDRQQLLSAPAASYGSVGMEQPSSETWQPSYPAFTAAISAPPSYS